MRSIERRFQAIAEKPSSWNRPTIGCFAMAVARQGFTANKMYYWFKRLVDPDDYARADRREILADMIYRINGLTRIKNQGLLPLQAREMPKVAYSAVQGE